MKKERQILPVDLSMLRHRYKALNEMVIEAKSRVKKAPPGMLHFYKRGAKMVYYHRTDKKEKTGKFIGNYETDIVRKLAQKYYDEKFIKLATKEISLLKRLIDKYDNTKTDSIYHNLDSLIQELITPAVYTAADYAKEWDTIQFTGNSYPFDKEFYTDNDERVRSKSELIIANMLKKNGITYKYECPLEIDYYNTIYPDFTIIHPITGKTVYWEHLGMMDNADYSYNAFKKIEKYENNGIFLGKNLIISAESSEEPLNVKTIQQLIDTYLFQIS